MPRLQLLVLGWPQSELKLLSILLSRGFDIIVYLRRDVRAMSSLLKHLWKRFDLIYLAVWGRNPLSIYQRIVRISRVGRNAIADKVVLGILEPVFAYPYRPSNHVWNALSAILLPFVKIFEPRALHVQNIFEYKMFKKLGFKVFRIPPGIDYEFVQKCASAKKQDFFTIVFTTLEYRKGADIAYHTIRYMLRRFGDTVAIVIRGGKRGYLDRPFRELQREFPQRLKYIEEYLPRAEFYRLLSGAHLLLFPSRWESFGRVVLDALAVGTPVVCFDIPGAPQDLIKNYVKYGIGYVARPFSITDFMRGVLRYYLMWKTAEEKFYNLAALCKKVASMFDYNRVATLFEKMFINIAS